MKLEKIFLLACAFLLSACATPPANRLTLLALPAASGAVPAVQATPELLLQATQGPEASATAGPDMVATQIELLHALQTAQADNGVLQSQINGQNVQMHQLDLDIEAAKLETAKYGAAQADSEARKSGTDAQIAKSQADALALQVEAERLKAETIKAQAAAEQAKAGQVIAFCVAAAFVVAVIVALRLVSRYPVARAPRDTETSHTVTNYVTETPGGFQHIERVPPPPGGINDQWLRWAHLARMGHSVAYNKMTGEGLPYKNSADYGPVYQWAWRNKIIGRNVKGVTVLTARGEQYLDDELIRAQYHAPAPDMNETQIMPPTNHTQDNPEHDPGGGVVL